MKRFFSLLLAGLVLLGPTVPSFAQESVPGEIPVAISTITNAQIVGVATVATGAFVHSFAGATLANFLDHKIKLTDTGSKSVYGYIKAAGSAEALGAEKFTDPPFDVDAAWTKGDGWVVGATGLATATTSTKDITEAIALTAGTLYKLVPTSSAVTGGTYQGQIEAADIGSAVNTVGATSWYRTVVSASAVANGIHAATSLTAVFTGISLKPVTAPSAAGVTISSTKGGATQSWAATETGFDANSATFTYTITKVHANPVVAGAAILATAVHVQTVSPALVFLDGIDLSPYASTATNSFYVCLYDSSNRALCAYTGAVGAGEALTALNADPGFATDAYWTKDASGWTSAAGAAVADAIANGKRIYRNEVLVVTGSLIKSVFTVSGATGGAVKTYLLGSTAVIGAPRSTNNTFTEYLGAAIGAANGVFGLQTSGVTTLSVDDYALSRVTAAPATGLDLRSTGKLGGTQVPVFTTTGFDLNAVTRWSVLDIGG